jgi:hypothetical protein
MYFPKVSPAIYLTLSSALLVPALANADQVILDDLIVDGSICAGLDCVNGESFGFDTLRLKENNLRIKAQDTSTTASFPSRDWQITFNDSSNGGANKFAIDDVDGGRTPFTIEAGAPSHSLYVDDGGRLGLGTSTPVVDIHVKSGNTPTLRLEQDGSSGFTPQTWDVAGNEANFFVRDASNGSTLPFRIKPGADSNSLFIAADNNVGMGTDAPKAKLHVLAGGAVFTPHVFTDLVIQDSGSTNPYALMSLIGGETGGITQLNMGHPGNEFVNRLVGYNHDGRMSIYHDENEQFSVLNDGRVRLGPALNAATDFASTHVLEHTNGAHLTVGGVWTNVSTRSAKENIHDLTYADSLSAVMELTPVVFNYKTEKGEDYAGFIAEDVPDLVATTGRKNLVAMDIVAALTKVVQEQQKSINTLTAQVEEMNQSR